MDLSTSYLKLKLEHPLMLGASPLVDDLDQVRRAEDDGASAIVMHSLFEEQIRLSRPAADRPRAPGEPPEARFYWPERTEFVLGPDEYLEQIRRIKAAVRVPVIGSLNGTTAGDWLGYAKLMDQAGADGLELTLYRVSTDPQFDAEFIEKESLDIVRAIKQQTSLPIAVKLLPHYTALAHFANRLHVAGADGLVVFNRVYQPDIHLDRLEVSHRVDFSSATELPLRLRWLAVLSAQLPLSLGVSGGVHSGADALKSVAVGAHGVQIVSEILKHGTRRFSEIRREMSEWLEAKGYDSLSQLHRSMNLSAYQNATNYERVNYIHTLQSWRPRKP